MNNFFLRLRAFLDFLNEMEAKILFNFFQLKSILCPGNYLVRVYDSLELESEDRLSISNIELVVFFVGQIFLSLRLSVLVTL